MRELLIKVNLRHRANMRVFIQQVGLLLRKTEPPFEEHAWMGCR